MGPARSVVFLAGLAAMTSLLAQACREVPSTDRRDASARPRVAAVTISTDAEADEAGATTADVDAATPIATAAPSATATELAAQLPPPTPFTGTYRCFGGMKLEQVGRIVTATIHKGTTDTVIACTAGGQTCTGSVREIQTAKGKAPKVTHVKPLTLTLTRSGDVVYVVGSPEKKTARGDQTLCPHR